jgi:hypothetical protein
VAPREARLRYQITRTPFVTFAVAGGQKVAAGER